jgi:uncharacterized protein YndB with AHSA1/START domain
MKKWYFEPDTFEPMPGFEFQFISGPSGREYMYICKVVEAIPNKKLSYTWHCHGYEGSALVVWEIG